jgi:hypothetical protein
MRVLGPGAGTPLPSVPVAVLVMERRCGLDEIMTLTAAPVNSRSTDRVALRNGIPGL